MKSWFLTFDPEKLDVQLAEIDTLLPTGLFVSPLSHVSGNNDSHICCLGEGVYVISILTLKFEDVCHSCEHFYWSGYARNETS